MGQPQLAIDLDLTVAALIGVTRPLDALTGLARPSAQNLDDIGPGIDRGSSHAGNVARLTVAYKPVDRINRIMQNRLRLR